VSRNGWASEKSAGKLQNITPRTAFEILPHDAGYAEFVDDDTLELCGIQHRRVADENGDTVWKTLYLQFCRPKEVKRIKRRMARLKKSLTLMPKHRRKARRNNTICYVKPD
jgi:hypothetical protein